MALGDLRLVVAVPALADAVGAATLVRLETQQGANQCLSPVPPAGTPSTPQLAARVPYANKILSGPERFSKFKNSVQLAEFRTGGPEASLPEEGGSDPVKLLVDVAGDQRLLKRYGHNVAALERHHFAEVPAVDHLAGGNSEARG